MNQNGISYVVLASLVNSGQLVHLKGSLLFYVVLESLIHFSESVLNLMYSMEIFYQF